MNVSVWIPHECWKKFPAKRLIVLQYRAMPRASHGPKSASWIDSDISLFPNFSRRLTTKYFRLVCVHLIAPGSFWRT